MYVKKLDNVDIEINTIWSSKNSRYACVCGEKFSNTYIGHCLYDNIMVPFPIRKKFSMAENSVVDVVFGDEDTHMLKELQLHIKMFKQSDKLNVPSDVIHIFISKNKTLQKTSSPLMGLEDALIFCEFKK